MGVNPVTGERVIKAEDIPTYPVHDDDGRPV